MSKVIPLPTVIFPLEPSQMVTRALDVIVENSEGKIKDVSIHSPLTALTEGLIWTELEFIAVLNQLPYAMLLAMLNTYGYQLALGSASLATVTVTLTTAIGSDISIAPGWRLASGSLIFVSTTALLIPAGQITASVDVVSEGVGSIYNVQPGAINGIAPLSANSEFIASLANLKASSGGLDAETVQDALLRATTLLHSRDALITLPDYENLASAIAGSGSRAVAVPSLGNDKISRELGCVHVFILNSNLLPASTAQLIDIERQMSLSVVAGTAVYISEIKLLDVAVKVICRLKDGVNPDDAFEVITTAINNYLDPYKWDAKLHSVLLKELEYLARDNPFVDFIQGCYMRVDDSQVFSALNIQLPNSYTLPRLLHLTVNMSSPLGEYSYGYGIDPRDTPETITQLPDPIV
jgi:hypothetical protein